MRGTAYLTASSWRCGPARRGRARPRTPIAPIGPTAPLFRPTPTSASLEGSTLVGRKCTSSFATSRTTSIASNNRLPRSAVWRCDDDDARRTDCSDNLSDESPTTRRGDGRCVRASPAPGPSAPSTGIARGTRATLITSAEEAFRSMSHSSPSPAKAADIAPSGFFVLRTPLLSLDAIASWSEGLVAPSVAEGSDGAIAQALEQDRAMLEERLRAWVSEPEIREALFLVSS